MFVAIRLFMNFLWKFKGRYMQTMQICWFWGAVVHAIVIAVVHVLGCGCSRFGVRLFTLAIVVAVVHVLGCSCSRYRSYV